MPDRTPSHEKLQAFLEDLVAVYARHGLSLQTTCDSSIFVVSQRDGDEALCIFETEEDDDPILSSTDYAAACPVGKDGVLALAPIPTTAHARLQAAARVAAIHKDLDDEAHDEACAELNRIPAYLEAETGRAVLTADDLEAATYILKSIWETRAAYGTPAALAAAGDWAREPDDGLAQKEAPDA
jgi:hypothetical protein